MSQKYIIELIPIIDILTEFCFYCLRSGRYDDLVSSVSSVVNKYSYPSIQSEIYADLQTACNVKKWNYHTLSRKGDLFHHDGYFVQRKPILRKGGEEKRKEKD